MQPVVKKVCNKEICTLPMGHNLDCIVEIKKEQMQLQTSGGMDIYEVYCGYNKDGQKLFEYLANSVNVEYYYE